MKGVLDRFLTRIDRQERLKNGYRHQDPSQGSLKGTKPAKVSQLAVLDIIDNFNRIFTFALPYEKVLCVAVLGFFSRGPGLVSDQRLT